MIPAALIILLIRSSFQGIDLFPDASCSTASDHYFYADLSYLVQKVMGKYANSTGLKMVLWAIAIVVTALNIGLFVTGF